VAESPDLDRVLDVLADLVFVLDDRGDVRFANEIATELVGVELSDVIGRSIADFVHPADLALVMSSVSTIQGRRRGTPIEVRTKDASGNWRWMEVIGTDRLDDEQVRGIICVARDITDRRMWEVAGGDIPRFQQVLQHASAITIVLDGAGVITGVSGAFTRLLGHDPANSVGRNLVNFIAPDDIAQLREALTHAHVSGEQTTAEVVVKGAASGFPDRPVRFEIVSLLDDPILSGFIVSGHDVTELRRARAELEHLARHDALTALANRSMAMQQLESILTARSPVAVVFIDLDRFKPVNDLHGHEAGDEVLVQVAERLRRAVRPEDVPARVGGDEFVVIAPGIGSHVEAMALAARIESELAKPFDLRAGPVRLTASTGITVASAGSTVTSLLADADMDMYEAKARRRGAPLPTRPEHLRSADERRRLAEDLAGGIARGEVVAHLQPIMELQSDRLVGFEALARWHHPDLGLLAPATFIDLAEDAGVHLELGDVLLASACRTLQLMGDAAHGLSLGINLSVGQLLHPATVSRILTVLDEHDFPIERLVVEVTERATIGDDEHSGATTPEATLLDLHRSGARLSLDDFGTGFSSLTHVRRFPLSSLKIDGSFVAGVSHNDADRAVVEATIGLARALGLRVVAEGVETAEQMAALRALGCDHVQGHFIARALAPADAVAHAARFQSRAAARAPSSA
jgi:diguanylate cyclase (GGDEF)-like protein/PAS domain S-box-containing protein